MEESRKTKMFLKVFVTGSGPLYLIEHILMTICELLEKRNPIRIRLLRDAP